MCDCLGLKPITGAEITVADGHHLTLLCENQKGYANLCRLLTHAHLQHERDQKRQDGQEPCYRPNREARDHPGNGVRVTNRDP